MFQLCYLQYIFHYMNKSKLCFVHSELARSLQDTARTGYPAHWSSPAEEEVFLLRPERGRTWPRPAQPALCPGQYVVWLAMSTITHFSVKIRKLNIDSAELHI